jgi:hypothetical protein
MTLTGPASSLTDDIEDAAEASGPTGIEAR